MRRLAPLLALLLVGCAGHGGGGGAVRAAGGGKAVLRVVWPKDDGRLIPNVSAFILVTVARADGTGKVTTHVGRPTGVSTTTTTITGLPYGILTVTAQAYTPSGVAAGSVAAGAGTMAVTEDLPGTVSIAMESTVASLSILPDPLTVSVGGHTTLTASAKDAQGAIVMLASTNGAEHLTWTSDDPTIDTVAGASSFATLTNVAAGIAHITATFVTTDAGDTVSSTATASNATPVFDLTCDTIVFGADDFLGNTKPEASGAYVLRLAPSATTSTDVLVTCTAPLSFSLPSETTSQSTPILANSTATVSIIRVNATRVETAVSATLTATTTAYGTVTRKVMIVPNPLASAKGSTSVHGGNTVIGTVNLKLPALSTESVSLSCSDPTVGLLRSVTVPGPRLSNNVYHVSASAMFAIKTPAVTTARTVTVSATRLGVTKTFDLTITP